MELAATITGSGEITYNNVAALLDDYLPENVLVYVPSYIQSDGMRVVVQWLKDANINVERVKKHLQFDFFLGNPDAKEKVLLVLGTDGCEEIIQECLTENISVLDLTRGLFAVDAVATSKTDVALGGAESNPNKVSDDSGSPVGSSNDLVLESLTEPQLNYNWLGRVQDEINTIRKHLNMSEINWEHTVNPRMPVAPEVEEVSADKEKYYRNGKGKIRKAGRSKIKPGEKEAWLSEEEAEELSK